MTRRAPAIGDDGPVEDEPETQITQPPEPAQAESTSAEPGTTPGEEPRRLRRSPDDRVVAGVCGGLGEHLGVDAVLIRIAAVILIFAGGAGLVLYVVGWIAIPEETGVPGRAAGPRPERASGGVVLGIIFIALGGTFLIDEIWPDFLSWKYVWPIALIAVGTAVLVRARR